MTRRAIVGVAVLVAIGLGAVLGRDQIDFVAVETSMSALGGWAPVMFAAAFAAGAVLFLPGTPFGLIGGALFGPVWGTAANLGGATLGATVAFLLARYIASDWVAQRAAGRLRQLVSGVEAEGWRFVALARLVPVVPFNLLNYALGLTRIPVHHYVVTTLVCMLPGTAAYTWLGYAGRNAVAGDATAIQYGLAALGLLAAIALLPRLVRRLRATPLQWLDPAELEHQRRTCAAPSVIDVRGPDEFAGPLGRIPGARNIPVDEIATRLPELTSLRDGPIVLVCKTDKRSARAAEVLRAAGFQATVLRGGMEAWNASHLPVERPTGAPRAEVSSA